MIIVVLLLAFILLTSSRNAQNAEATRVIADGYSTGTAIVALAATDSANASATVIALASHKPTVKATLAQATLTPEISLTTPTPTPAPTGTALPYPIGMSGRLVGWSGRDVTQTGYLPIVVYNFANNGEAVQLSDAVGEAYVTVATHWPGLVLRVICPGQVIAGACPSFTVTVKVQRWVRPAPSVACQMTEVTPLANVEPLRPPLMWSRPAPVQLSE